MLQSPATPFHIMLKPRGPICNLDCKYCYFLSKERLYSDSGCRMDAGLLENYTRQFIAAQPRPAGGPGATIPAPAAAATN